MKEQESGVTVAQICREHAISEGTFCRWKSKYAGMFIELDKPTQNGLIESFNGKMRDQCFNLEWFTNPQSAREIIQSGEYS